MSNAIWLPGYPSTVSVMEWIRDHGCPMLKSQDFAFGDGPMGEGIMVSEFSESDLESILTAYPKEFWHEVLDMKRLTFSRHSWYFYIDGHFYYASM